ncbi:lamin-like protein [Cajanus cajan]|uniref:Lamin-like protein n=1 Tax=Cajanus cajan TaxID=3821 RepID=A0A151T046_CAJCA|nr:lamin-like protein [Cajanus cajan]KYP60409.1 Lamin-like protein [Cajanus cajan]
MEKWSVSTTTLAASTAVMGWLLLVVMGGPVLHKVGGSRGWIDHDVNYTEWSSQQHVYVGDWLLFMFDKRYFNVLEVNKTSYEKCEERDFMKNVTRGGRDVVQLTEAKTYYFLSAGGYCFHGMKVAVNVQQHQQPAEPSPAPAPAPSSAAVSPAFWPSIVTGVWIMVAHVKLVLMG